MKALLLFAVLLLALGYSPVLSAPRPIPSPLPDHPGNVFVAGEEVVLRLPSGQAGLWRAYDYEERELAAPRVAEGRASLGPLPPGFYRLRREGSSNWVSCAVLAPLKAPTPADSPVALDVAMAWFYGQEKMEAAANLCALAGVNRVRDRLAWGEMERKPGQYANTNRYDLAARAQSQARLQVLQVNHSSPGWANPAGKRFPLDLRDAYRFYREMARRWRGQVVSFEPWNEADISQFGGHTGAEMASMQKASYLGLKAGNPEVIACLNVFASHNRAQLQDLRENEAWPYFDTFNLHHYETFDRYPQVYADFRAVSAGRPLWVSECAVPVKWAGDPALKEPTDADLRVQAERVAKVFAGSLHEGSVATFYFLLPHYVEGQTQFGVLRPDLTPRPAYVALAAVGRLLADAKPLGRLEGVPDTVRGWVFDAKPDGKSQEVLVAWTIQGQTNLDLPVAATALYDHLGRTRPVGAGVRLSTAPVFAVLPAGSANRLKLQAPPRPPERLPGEPYPIVLQALWPADKLVLPKSAYRLSSEQIESIPLFVYNFSDSSVSGTLGVAAPAGWRIGALDKVEIGPHSRVELRLELDGRKAVESQRNETIRVVGDFGATGKPVLSVRVSLDTK